MKTALLKFFAFLIGFSGLAQEDAWVYLSDKSDVAASLANPNTILTQRAIDRKALHNINIDERDVPLNESYKNTIAAQPGITVLAKSKWMNALHVRGAESDIRDLGDLSIVASIDFANKTLADVNRTRQPHDKFIIENTAVDFVYGSTQNQVEMLGVDDLHMADYTGDGMLIAVMDSGFPNVETMAAFERIRSNGDYLGGYDFVDRTSDVTAYSGGDHGTRVLSVMAGYIENQYVGTAPDASYILFRTEDGGPENPVEESYWVEAAERADSLGVNIINTSLGYTTYDNSNYSYTPSDMDSETAFITRGANIAAEKGILVVTSAGNSGNSSWGVVGAPADGSGVFSIGAVTPAGNYASFSSQGSSDQPTQKPDVVAQGAPASVITSGSIIVSNNGTSFSSPLMAGSLASLWQSVPSTTAEELKQLVRQSGSQSNSPNNLLGYGIPDLSIALNALFVEEKAIGETIKLYPNPTKSDLYLASNKSLENVKFEVYNILGKKVFTQNGLNTNKQISVSRLSAGVYLLKIYLPNSTKSLKFIKS